MPVMFKGREVKVGDKVWRSRRWGGGTIEYEVTEIHPGSKKPAFSAKTEPGSGWRDEISIREDRREDVDCHHWTKEDAEEDSAKCTIISDIQDVAENILREHQRESLWRLSSANLRLAYDAMAALLLAVADAEQEKDQSNG